MYAFIYVCMYVYMHVCMHAYAFSSCSDGVMMYAFMYVCMYVCSNCITMPPLQQKNCLYMYAFIYVCMYVCMWWCVSLMHAFIHT